MERLTIRFREDSQGDNFSPLTSHLELCDCAIHRVFRHPLFVWRAHSCARSRPRSIPPGLLVILSAAKDLHSTGDALPGTPRFTPFETWDSTAASILGFRQRPPPTPNRPAKEKSR